MIFHETALQPRLFLLLLCAGMSAGLLYDLFGLIRRKVKPFAGALLDVVWCVCTAALCFFCLYFGRSRQVRLFLFFSMALGAGLYALGVRRLGKQAIFFINGRKKQRPRRNPPHKPEGGMRA